VSSRRSNKECAGSRRDPRRIRVAVSAPNQFAGCSSSGGSVTRSMGRTERCVFGIELPQGFDGIAEQFEAHGPLRFRRKNVDDSAAHRELAGHFHHVMGFVADAAKMRDQFVQRNTFVPGERARLLRVVSRVGKAHASGRNGATTTRASPVEYRHRVTARVSRISA
jgi:hypothetical protein